MSYYSQPDYISTSQEALNLHTVDLLKSLAALLPGTNVPTRKAEIIDYILPHLQGAALKKLWAQCDRLQQLAIAETVYSDGDRYPGTKFVNKYGSSPTWGKSPGGFGYGHRFQATVLDLFFFRYVMPRDLQQSFRAFVKPPEPARIQGQVENPTTISRVKSEFNQKTRTRQEKQLEYPLQIRETEQVARRELLTILRLVDLGKIAISDKTFYPTGATLTKIGEVLEEGDYYSDWSIDVAPEGYTYSPVENLKPFGWVMLLQAGKLVELSGKQLVLTKAGQKALQEPPEKTLQTIWKNWQKTTLFDELRRVKGVKGQTGKGKRSLTAVAGRRSHIVNTLKDCPVDRWIRVRDLFKYMLAAGHDLVVSRSLENLTIGGDTSGYYEPSFLLLEGRYIVCCLFEYIATLGLVDVCFLHPEESQFTFDEQESYYSDSNLSDYDGLVYFRITPLGAYLLEITDRYEAKALPKKQVLRILPNQEIVATEQLSRADRLMLDSYLQVVSDSVWKLDQGKLLDALSQGRTVEDFKTFLVANSSTALPQTVQQLLADLQNRSTSLQDLGTARLIRCADPALAILIANDSRTKAFCFLADQPQAMKAGAACYLVVPLETETKFRNALKKIGYSLS